MESSHNALFHHNQENDSEEDFNSSGSEESPLLHLFQELNEETTDNKEQNDTINVPINMRYSENSKITYTSGGKQSAISEDIEKEPKLEPQELLIWTLKHNKFERFSSLLKEPEVDPKFKYDKPHYTTCMELACRLHWGGKFVKILLEHGVKTNVHEIHQEPIHYAAKCAKSGALDVLLQNENTKIKIGRAHV